MASNSCRPANSTPVRSPTLCQHLSANHVPSGSVELLLWPSRNVCRWEELVCNTPLMILWRQTVNQLWSARTLPHLLPGYAKMTCSPAKEGTLVSQTFSGSCPFICLNFPAFLQWSCESHIPSETLYTPLNAFNGPCLATITHLTTHRTTPSIHPSSSAYPGLGCRGSCLSKDTQTSLSPDTSSSSPGRVPRHSQAS